MIVAFLGIYSYKPAHDKTYNKNCATSETSDQLAHARRLIRLFADRMCISQHSSYQKKDERERLSYWVDLQVDLTGYTGLTLGFAVRWLICLGFSGSHYTLIVILPGYLLNCFWSQKWRNYFYFILFGALHFCVCSVLSSFVLTCLREEGVCRLACHLVTCIDCWSACLFVLHVNLDWGFFGHLVCRHNIMICRYYFSTPAC